MTLITPIGMLITVALLALYAIYAGWTAYIDKSWVMAIVAALAVAACIGAGRLLSWSRWLVYLLTAGFIAAWCHSVYTASAAGYFEYFFSSPQLAMRSLVPGLALVLLSLACSYMAFRHFRAVRLPPGPGEPSTGFDRSPASAASGSEPAP